MTPNWKKFSESKLEYPEAIVQNAIKGFSEAANHLAEIGIRPTSEFGRITSGLNTEFQFEVTLWSKYLTQYSLTVFSFGYRVDLVPISIDIEDSIYEEIQGRPKQIREFLTIEDQHQFESLIEIIFSCSRFSQIVEGLMKIAAKEKRKADQLPE